MPVSHSMTASSKHDSARTAGSGSGHGMARAQLLRAASAVRARPRSMGIALSAVHSRRHSVQGRPVNLRAAMSTADFATSASWYRRSRACGMWGTELRRYVAGRHRRTSSACFRTAAAHGSLAAPTRDAARIASSLVPGHVDHDAGTQQAGIGLPRLFAGSCHKAPVVQRAAAHAPQPAYQQTAIGAFRGRAAG